MDISAQLQKAIELHGIGRLQEAADLYQGILQVQPGNGDALNLLGVIHHAAGQMDNAILLIRKAIEAGPDYFAPYVNLGNVLQATGQLDEAVAAFQEGLSLNPGDPAAATNLSSVLNELGRHKEAVQAAQRALANDPVFAQAHTNLGNALQGLGRMDEAEASFRMALRLNPEDATAHYNLGSVLLDTGDPKEAVTHCERAVMLDPDAPEKHYNLGNAYQAAAQMEKAIESFRNVIQLDPSYVDAHSNLGAALHFLGRPEEAIRFFQKAVALEPDSPDLHWNLSLALLKNGAYEEGWREYEWRWRTPAFVASKRDFAAPRWQGEPLQGRRILIEAEQGFGDSIEFARYATLVAAMGAHVVLECRPGLERLFTTLEGVSEIVTLGQTLPPHDLHIPLLSLPNVLGTRLETVPTSRSYLSVPEGAAKDRLIGETPGLKVGFVWAGSPTRVDDDKRSADPALFEPLFDMDGAAFFSLQVGDARSALEPYLDRDNVHDPAQGFKDFAHTAAAVQALDLVISVDTSVLHLAGALGKPVWGLLSYPTGFLWMEDRDDSPWYPSVRLYRQSQPGDWESIFRRVKEDLAGLLAERAPVVI